MMPRNVEQNSGAGEGDEHGGAALGDEGEGYAGQGRYAEHGGDVDEGLMTGVFRFKWMEENPYCDMIAAWQTVRPRPVRKQSAFARPFILLCCAGKSDCAICSNSKGL